MGLLFPLIIVRRSKLLSTLPCDSVPGSQVFVIGVGTGKRGRCWFGESLCCTMHHSSIAQAVAHAHSPIVLSSPSCLRFRRECLSILMVISHTKGMADLQMMTSLDNLAYRLRHPLWMFHDCGASLLLGHSSGSVMGKVEREQHNRIIQYPILPRFN